MNIGTLFSGIGAPEQALLRINPNFKTIFACEWDKYARQSYLANYDIDEAHFHKDINDMDGTQYKGKVNIIIGGSPCQDFSLAGLRAGVNGQKGILIYQYIRIIKEVMPPIFIYENVKGMLSDKGGRTLKEFIEAFRDMGYHCHYDVLNTKDYGVPQNRERLFIVGFKDSEHYHRFNFAPKIKLVKRLKDILEIDVKRPILTEKIIESFTIKSKSEFAKRFKIVNLENINIANCLDARNPRSTRTQTFFYYDNFVSYFTPREYLRLQDFPDIFKQVVSDSQLYKQAGNSITVAVMEMILRQIINPIKQNTLFQGN